MSSQRSPGSKLGVASGIVLIVAFFLPLIGLCGTTYTGYAIFADAENFEYGWLLGAVPMAGLFCLGMFLLLRTDTADVRFKSAVLRLSATLTSLVPFAYLTYQVLKRSFELLWGWGVMAMGFLGLVISVVMDLAGAPREEDDYD